MAPRPSADFRERLVLALDAGLSPGDAARLFGGDRRTVFRWQARHRRGESLAEQARPGRPPQLPRVRYEQLRALVLAHPAATLPEHAARLAAPTGVSLSPSHLRRRLAKLGRRRKTSAGLPPHATRLPAPPGARRWPPSIRRGSSFVMNPVLPRR